MEQIVKNIEMIVHGPPPIDERWRDYADKRDAHKERNAQQDAQDIRDEMEHEKSRRDRQHESNERRLGKLERLAYIGIGMMLILKLVPGDLIGKLIH